LGILAKKTKKFTTKSFLFIEGLKNEFYNDSVSLKLLFLFFPLSRQKRNLKKGE